MPDRTARPFLSAFLFATASFGTAFAPAHAQLRVEITGVGSNQFPIAVATFQREGSVPQEIHEIVREDLKRSGMFRNIDPGSTPVAETAQVNLGDWKGRGADAFVAGSMTRLADGRYDVRYRLYDTIKGTAIDGQSYVASVADLRITAHRIADRIYEKLTGERGVFATRIAYVVQTGRNAYELQIADSDGFNPQAALRSREPIISPTWSADGTKLAYVSFELGKAVVYVHTITTGERKPVANFRGSNSAPAFSPDGRTLAVALARDGLTQIYSIPADGGNNPRRLTNSGAIDTEPCFTPDGKQIYFTSDRGGGPQIYRMGVDGGAVARVTFNGDYNVSPRVSPDGKSVVYVSRRSGRFQVYTLDLATGQELLLTDTTLDESPSYAPNGRLVLYATEIGGRGVLASASTDGRIKTRLSGPTGNIREPTWGPFIK